MRSVAALPDEEFASLEAARAVCICLTCPYGELDAKGDPKGLCFSKPNCENCYHPEVDKAKCDTNCFSGLK